MFVQSQDGTAAVVGGALVIVPPRTTGGPPCVRAEAGIDLLVPGQRAGPRPGRGASPTPTSTCACPTTRPQLEVRVDVTPDELLATMTVERVPGARYRLEDQPPNPTVTLRRLVAERIPCPEPSLDDLYGALADHGVV